MPRCEKCGSEVTTPIKAWRVGRNVVGQFLCPVCGHRFKGGVKNPSASRSAP